MLDSPAGVSIREMRASDVDAVVAIESEAFSTPWRPETFEGLLGRDGVVLLVLEHPAEGVIGYAVLWCVLDQGELANVAVDRAYRGSGLGRYLIEQVVEVGRARGLGRIFLEVRRSNTRAVTIYETLGFVDVGVRKDYYTEPQEDARVMVLSLD